jgi:Do/DeqQ family serine protease
MKPKFFLSVLTVSALFAAGISPAQAASAKSDKDAKTAKATTTAPANKKPELRIDTTAISDGKSSVLTSYADVVEPVQKAVVSIYSTKIIKERLQVNPLFRQFFPGLQDQERESRQEGLGSGVIVTSDGYILTNNHVVEGADELKVSLDDDREFVGKVIGTDPKTDVAIIKIEADQLPTVVLADSEKLRVGDVVFAVGNPLGVGQTVTMGIVSAKGRNKVGILDGGYEDFIQTDAAINMGNSGGALVDAKGRLVGINSAILSPSRGNIGIGFAIPINLAASIMNSLVATGSVARGHLGVTSADSVTADVAEQLGLPRSTKGVLVTDLEPNSPAEKSGLKRTDIILALDGHAVSSLEDLRLRISQMIPGTTTKIKVARDGRERTIEVTLDKLTDNPNELLPGVSVEPLNAEYRRRLNIDSRLNGLVITEIAETSPFRGKLEVGLVVLEINRTAATDITTAISALNPPGQKNLIAYYYRGQARYMVVVVPVK